MNITSTLLRFLQLVGIVFALGVMGIGLSLTIMLVTYYALIAL